jgi:hypothetical protein
MGLPHSDNPSCVHPAVRSFKIALNDSDWSSNSARAKGLRRIAVAQLGSEEIDGILFVKELALATIRKIVPIALRAAASIHPIEKHKNALSEAAKKCENQTDLRYAASDDASTAAAAAIAAIAATAARDASYAASDAARCARDAARYARDAASDASAASYARDASAASAASTAAAAAIAATAARDASAVRGADIASDAVLEMMAECAVQTLVKCESPGCKWLSLCK